MSTTRTRSKGKLTISDEQHSNQWLNIAVLVVFISSIIVAVGIGIRIGKRQGEETAINFMMERIHDNLDNPCFNQLAKNLEKGKP